MYPVFARPEFQGLINDGGLLHKALPLDYTEVTLQEEDLYEKFKLLAAYLPH